MRSQKPLVEGLPFPEGPRWRDEKLFFSDQHRHVVLVVDSRGRVDEVCHVPNRPSGLGWLPDGRMLVVSLTDRKLMRLEQDQLRVHADLAELASWDCNDMVVDAHGRAYVSSFG